MKRFHLCDMRVDSQFGGQVRRSVVFVLDDIIALVEGLEDGEGVSDAVERGQVFSQQLPCRRSRVAADQIGELLHQLFLLFLHIHLLMNNIH